jgi:hypothetical protein
LADEERHHALGDRSYVNRVSGVAPPKYRSTTSLPSLTTRRLPKGGMAAAFSVALARREGSRPTSPGAADAQGRARSMGLGGGLDVGVELPPAHEKMTTPSARSLPERPLPREPARSCVLLLWLSFREGIAARKGAPRGVFLGTDHTLMRASSGAALPDESTM